jgi:pyrroloquinoline quinone biosynthesis protein E
MQTPLVLIAELTHRCPLHCAYCSNPLELERGSSELTTADWQSVARQAAALGVLQLHLTGGEPLLRPDLEIIAATASASGLYTTLITSGLGAKTERAFERLATLARSGLRAVQVSFQDTLGSAAAAVSGRDALAEKLAFAGHVRELDLSLTVNVVLHRGNIGRIVDFIELGASLGADRLELAHVQYQGWARQNQELLLPSAAQLAQADRLVARAKLLHAARLEILYVMPDHLTGRAKPCMGGLGERAIVVSPSGEVLPCHAARQLPFQHERVQERTLADIWQNGAAFQAFRGEGWMEEPCKSCSERGHDRGGCRCQALALTGRATATDPACRRSPEHGRVLELRQRASAGGSERRYLLRGYAPSPVSEAVATTAPAPVRVTQVSGV